VSTTPLCLGHAHPPGRLLCILTYVPLRRDFVVSAAVAADAARICFAYTRPPPVSVHCTGVGSAGSTGRCGTTTALTLVWSAAEIKYTPRMGARVHGKSIIRNLKMQPVIGNFTGNYWEPYYNRNLIRQILVFGLSVYEKNHDTGYVHFNTKVTDGQTDILTVATACYAAALVMMQAELEQVNLKTCSNKLPAMVLQVNSLPAFHWWVKDTSVY